MAESSKASGDRDDLPREDGDLGDPATPHADEELTPDGRDLVAQDMADPVDEVTVAADDTEAAELVEAEEVADDTPDKGDPEDVEISDPEELEAATADARSAGSSHPRPVKRNQTVAPVKKAAPTRKRDEAAAAPRQRTTPAKFVQQSAGELKKVVWPTAAMTRSYFLVVLVFVLFIMFFVAGLDALFGWVLLQVLG